MTLWSVIRQASSEIENGRTEVEIFKHLMTEVGELFQEQIIAEGRSYKAPGKDGPIGEAVDVLLCAADLIMVRHPCLSEGEMIRTRFDGHAGADIFAAALATETTSNRPAGEILTALVRATGEIAEGIDSLDHKAADPSRMDFTSSAALDVCADCLAFIMATDPDIGLEDIGAIARPKIEKWQATAGAATPR